MSKPEHRSVLVSFRVTEAEKAQIEAARGHQSKSDYLRCLVFSGIVRHPLTSSNTDGEKQDEKKRPLYNARVREDKEKAKKKTKRETRLAPLDISAEILDHLNGLAGTGYRASGKTSREFIAKRLADGYTVEDFKTVNRKKCTEWKGDKTMERHLKPQTLYGGKFDQYLGQPEAEYTPQSNGATGHVARMREAQPPAGDPRWEVTDI